MMNIQAKAEDYYPRLIMALDRYKGKGLWVHFSEQSTLGLGRTAPGAFTVRPKHNDPTGVYLFPLDYIRENYRRHHNWVFTRYMHVCQVNTNSILNLASVTEAQVADMLERLGMIDEYTPSSKLPGENLWDFLKDKAIQKPAPPSVFRKFFQQLGIDAVYDPGTGTIHSHEPNQMVVMDPKSVQVVEIVDTGCAPLNQQPQAFHSPNTKPAIELCEALAKALGSRVTRTKRNTKTPGEWMAQAIDSSGNRITLNVAVSSAYDRSEFRARFSVSWHSDGQQVYVSDRWGTERAVEFSIDTEYTDVVSDFAARVREKMSEQPPDDTSYVAEPLTAIAEALGAKWSAETPISGQVAKQIGSCSLRVSLYYDSGYKVTCFLKVPNAINPQFGPAFDEVLPADTVVDTVLENLAGWLSEVMDKHFPEGDWKYDSMRRQVTPVLSFLEGIASKGMAYHAISKLLRRY